MNPGRSLRYQAALTTKSPARVASRPRDTRKLATAGAFPGGER